MDPVWIADDAPFGVVDPDEDLSARIESLEYGAASALDGTKGWWLSWTASLAAFDTHTLVTIRLCLIALPLLLGILVLAWQRYGRRIRALYVEESCAVPVVGQTSL